MGSVGRFGMDRRIVYFVLLSIIVAALLIPLSASILSPLVLDRPAEPLNEPMSEMVTLYFLTVLMSMVMALGTLPVTLPLTLGAWIASHWLLFDGYREKWRIRIAAVVSGLVGCAFWIAVLNDGEKWQSILVVLTPAVLIGVLVSAEIVYRAAKRETR